MAERRGCVCGIDADGNWYERDLTPDERKVMDAMLADPAGVIAAAPRPGPMIVSKRMLDMMRQVVEGSDKTS